MEERHLNIKKVIITVAIFIFAFLIILGSALLTSNASKNKEKKQLSIKPKESSSQTSEEQGSKENEGNSYNIENSSNKDNNDSNNNLESKDDNKIDNNYDNKTDTKPENPSKPDNNQGLSGKDPVYNENCQALAKGIYNSDEKQIFLTFDDGPSPNVTPQILEILKRYNVPATFFVLGSRVELYPELLKQEYNSGHYIANHGYTHTYSSIYSSVQAVVDEYNATETAIQNAIQNPNYHSYLFRFPGGSSGGVYDKLKAEAKSYLVDTMKIATTNWNCLTGDAEGGKRTKEQLLDRLYETAGTKTSLVILMHDANDKQTTADALPELIEHYLQEGYTFKNYYEIFK